MAEDMAASQKELELDFTCGVGVTECFETNDTIDALVFAESNEGCWWYRRFGTLVSLKLYRRVGKFEIANKSETNWCISVVVLEERSISRS